MTVTGKLPRMLHPDFPVVSGNYQLTANWRVQLPSEMNRRIEDESMVLWRPGLTAWISVWGNDQGRTPREQLEWIREDISPDATHVDAQIDRRPALLTYRVDENRADGIVIGYYGFVASSEGYVQVAIYLDEEEDLEEAKSIVEGLSPATA